ncbi:MAG: glycosyltransferase, partial [Ignavibacteriales bacterium]|nr:glycosyltransferase [Ignavibacteriales bacterium]
MRLNIAFVNSIPIFGGGEVWTLEAAKEMERRGHAAVVVCREGAELKPRAERAGVDVVEFPFGGDLDPLAIRRAARLLNKFLIDVVVANTDKDLRLFGLASKFGGRAAIVARKGVDRPLKNALRYRLAYNRLASAVVANSESTKRTML